jgi:hypothetical protein
MAAADLDGPGRKDRAARVDAANRLLHKRFPLPREARQVIAASLKRA